KLEEIFGRGLAQSDDALRLLINRDLHAAVVDGAPTLGGSVLLRTRNEPCRQGHANDAGADPPRFILHSDLPSSVTGGIFTGSRPAGPHPTPPSLWRSMDTYPN